MEFQFENLMHNNTFIIAEIGQNHQGDINTAKKLIDVAQQCGADCVKFQKTCLTEKFNFKALRRPYSSENSFGATYGEHKTFLDFSNDEFIELQQYAKMKNILFTASAMDRVSLNFLASIGVPFIKIGSGDSNNLILIKQAAALDIPLVISTGMLSFKGVQKIYNTVKAFHKNFALLHCVSAYPAPLEDINLKAIQLYKEKFSDIVIGYSGHELGLDVSIAAVALEAKIIERHLTLDKNQKGSDHCCSLDPGEFSTLVGKIRKVEVALGRPEKLFRKSEQPCYEKLGKSLVAARDLEKGDCLTMGDVVIKVAEPKGIDGSQLQEVLGKKLKVCVEEDESITENCLE